MPLYTTKAEVFDPALSDEAYLPVRLEITVMGLPEEPTFADVGAQFTVTHYSWLQRIFSEEWDWSETDNAANAAIYNSSVATETLEPVVPVTVLNGESEGGQAGFGEEYFIRVSRAQRILRYIERKQGHGGYELLPDPTYAMEKKSAWYFQHSNRMCIECTRLLAQHSDPSQEIDVRGIPEMCKPFKVLPHRLVTLCTQHSSVFNEERKGERLFYTNDAEWSGK